MKTTLDIHDELLAAAKALAARQRTTLTRLVEEGLQLRLHTQQQGAVPRALPVFRGKGGLCPGVDGRSNASLFAAVEGDDA
jgi:hypothetical protein